MSRKICSDECLDKMKFQLQTNQPKNMNSTVDLIKSFS